MVLFPEGTSWRGDEVLPFRSALLGAARTAILHGGHERVWVQPLTLAYKRLGGLPIGRAERARVGWYGDTELPRHLWGVFLAGGLDVEVIWGEALPFDETTNRKTLAATLEATVRRDLLAALRP
jgi:1-acyl-sn-glycerol-3-phosphate acyltransferase